MSKYHGYTKEQFRLACHNRLKNHCLSDFITSTSTEPVEIDISFLATRCQIARKDINYLFDRLIDDEGGVFDEWLLLWMADSEEVKYWGEF